MHHKTALIALLSALTLLISCQSNEHPKTNTTVNKIDNLATEKSAILQVLNDETKAAFNRDYKSWQDKWVHQPYVTKTYMNFAENTMTETLGWEEINDFVKTYIEEHPEPAPLPTLVDYIEVRLYENGAWVSYSQNNSERGLKRETRLMEKINGQWKIAGMQTVIYGFEE